jgi:5-methylcytosine-specific restriction endonuclease McrA
MDCLMPFPFKVTKSGNTIHATIRCPACAAANQERSRGKAMARRLHASRLGDNPNWRRLVARDGDRCHICGVHTSTLLGPLDDNYPTVDHLVPIAAGGTDTMDNCKVACRRCNISRGAGPVRKRKQRA